MQTVQNFFIENPTATNCFVALGIVKSTFEEALALLGGTKFQYVTTFTKDGEVTGNDIDELLKAYNKCADDENVAQQQYEQMPSEDNMQKWKDTQKSSQLALLAFHNLILKKSKASEKLSEEEFINKVIEKPVVTDQPAAEAEKPVVTDQPGEEVK